VRKIEGEEVRLLLHAADDDQRLAKVRLRMSRRMAQWPNISLPVRFRSRT
jgi:hypothetical protein